MLQKWWSGDKGEGVANATFFFLEMDGSQKGGWDYLRICSRIHARIPLCSLALEINTKESSFSRAGEQANNLGQSGTSAWYHRSRIWKYKRREAGRKRGQKDTMVGHPEHLQLSLCRLKVLPKEPSSMIDLCIVWRAFPYARDPALAWYEKMEGHSIFLLREEELLLRDIQG